MLEDWKQPTSGPPDDLIYVCLLFLTVSYWSDTILYLVSFAEDETLFCVCVSVSYENKKQWRRTCSFLESKTYPGDTGHCLISDNVF